MAKSSKKNDVLTEAETANSLFDSLFQKDEAPKIIDVRTPAEFSQGHIIGAYNIPLLSNEERAEVGTLFKQASPTIAFDKGIELVGPKMHSFIKAAREYMADEKAYVYCWRGGKRSQSMSWLFNMAGLQSTTIPGGYKAYRQYVVKVLGQARNLVVVGGKTGSGKTKILHELAKKGEQIIDLEGIANHKGSAFGWIGEDAQPATEQFENILASKVKTMDLEKPIWIENESRMIGKIALQQDFWDILKTSPLVNIDIPKTERIKHLIDTYKGDSSSDLKLAFNQIQKRLGGLRLQHAVSAIDEEDYATAAEIALTYYDKSYTKLLLKNQTKNIYKLNFEQGDFARIATSLIEHKKEMK